MANRGLAGRQEVSTSEIAEHASRKLRSVSMETVMRCWHSLGTLIQEKYDEGKGASIDRFGTFTIAPDKRPVFCLHADFSSAYRVRQNKKYGIGAVPTTRLNYAKLATVVGITREVARQIVDEMILSLGTAIRKRGQVRLSFVPVCELLVDRGIATMRFGTAALAGATAAARAASDLDAVAGVHYTGSTSSNGARNGARSTTLLNQLGKFGRDVAAHDRQTQTAEAQRRHDEQQRWQEEAEDDEMYRRGPLHGGGHGQRAGRRGGRERCLPAELEKVGPRRPRRRNSSPPRIPSPNHAKPFDGAAWGSGSNARDADDDVLSRQEGYKGRCAAWDEHPHGRATRSPMRGKSSSKHRENPLIKRVRDLIIERGGEHGIHTLRRVMAVMDHSGDKSLSREELCYGLRDYGVVLRRGEADQVFDHFDKDGSGSIDFDEFLFALRGELNEHRLGLVKAAFKKLDKTRDGVITIDDLRECYDASQHPDVVARKLTADEVSAPDFASQLS